MSTAANICKSTPLMVALAEQFQSKWVGAVEDVTPASQYLELRLRPVMNVGSGLTADTRSSR